MAGNGFLDRSPVRSGKNIIITSNLVGPYVIDHFISELPFRCWLVVSEICVAVPWFFCGWIAIR